MYSYSHSEDIYVEQDECGTLNVISSQGALNKISDFFNYRTGCNLLATIYGIYTTANFFK